MKSLTIALATAKETIRQPAFFVMAAFAGGLLLVTIWVSYFTFGEDIKMYKDTGLTTISFFCMLLALLTASSTVADEIEGKTAITLLSKPINRRQFIVGKFLGIELGALALFVILGALFGAGVWVTASTAAPLLSVQVPRTVTPDTFLRLVRSAKIARMILADRITSR